MPDKLSDTATAVQQVELAVCRLDSLATLPCVGAQLFFRLSRGQFSHSALADIIDSDPALTAKILSIISRRGPGLPEKRFHLRHLIDQLPAHEVRDAVLSVQVLQPMDLDMGTERTHFQLKRGLLLHSLAVACCAQEIAEIASRQIDPQLAYCAGLLHDIGKLALQDTMPKSFVRIVEEGESTKESCCSVEQKHLGTNHAVIGKHLAQRWQLPNKIALAIWLHHSETVTISREMPESTIAVLIQLADSIARQLNIGQSGSFDLIQPQENLIDYLGINLEQLEQIRRKLSKAVEKKSEVLGLDLPNALADYCRSSHAAAAQWARQDTELSLENRRLQSASSHLDFAADFLLSVNPISRAVDIAENFATRWQRFYQTGMVCLYLVPSSNLHTLETVIVEKLSQSKQVFLEAPTETPAIPKAIINNFSILNAHEHAGWLFEQLDVDFDVSRSKLVPLLSAERAIGAIVFELNYPGDTELFEEKFKTSASIAGTVLGMALEQHSQQHFAERLVRLISPAASGFPSPSDDAGITQAEDLLTALAEMASGAAHELNNPLAVIAGRAQLLAEAQSDKETKEILKQIYENAREASGIIEDMMSFAEPPRPRAADTDVKKMLDEAVQLTSRKTNMEDLDVQIEVAGDIESIVVDSAQIVSAIANVITNAVESYGGQIGPIQIFADNDESGKLVTLAVRDQGCGMDAETVKKATQPFFSAKPAGRKRGMGLAYAARFVQINKGTLNIESEPGSGTTVTISFPCK